ncbi:MAG: 4-hydroxy-tetrahydrodipicolinate reductase, partial [Acetatifactor sp.]|nr:4-hydroxy-tetrahydrodipicolinate reductase [Acetatifactor sp.]
MIRIIMRGCNGKMGQSISNLLSTDPEAEMVAGVDIFDAGRNTYPVFPDFDSLNVEADCLIDFAAAKDIDKMLDYCVKKKLPCVLCTTGLSEEQLNQVNEASKKVAILRSANMSLGINLLLKMLKEATAILAPAGFDIEIVEKH